ncbi:MAG: 50S ribosomal protein L11 methyltransferase, partial [Cobetia sp.]
MSWLQLKARIAPDHAEILEHLLMEEGACAITL